MRKPSYGSLQYQKVRGTVYSSPTAERIPDYRSRPSQGGRGLKRKDAYPEELHPLSPLARGARIETKIIRGPNSRSRSRPSQGGRGLKLPSTAAAAAGEGRPSQGGRGLKPYKRQPSENEDGRPSQGGRGLKLTKECGASNWIGRPSQGGRGLKPNTRAQFPAP